MTYPRDDITPYWLRTAAPSGANGGLLDSLTRPADEPWNDPRPMTFAQTPWGSMTPPPSLFGQSPTFPPSPPPSSWDPSSPAFLWHPPFGANAGFPAPTAQPVIEPWNDPRSAIFAQTPWVPMTPPPPFVPPSAFPPALPLEHLDSGKYWPVAPAPSGPNEQPPSHGFYFPPVPQAPSWDSVPADASITGLGQLFPQPPGLASWLASAAGASYSSADEALMADDARRVAADRLKRGMQRTIPIAPPPEHLSPSNPLVHGFYLSPVGQAPSWEQVVPTATPWSVSPKLPSPTAWGNTERGIECNNSEGNATCTTPGGRQVSFPVPRGFPAYIGPGEPDYHYYNKPVGAARGDPSRLMEGVINSPTPGPSGLVRAATPEGTLNEATPITPYNALVGLAASAGPFGAPLPPATSFSSVKSYLTTDQNGLPVMVNATEPGHPLYPGIVMRYVTTSKSGSTIQNEGAGLGWLQGPGILGSGRELINNVWRDQSKGIVEGQSQGVNRRTHRVEGQPLGRR